MISVLLFLRLIFTCILLQIVNPHLLKDLIEANLWNDDLKNQLMANNGSVQNIIGVPDWIKQLYKTVWEISQRDIIDMAADRGAFIDQSQSLNLHIAAPTYSKCTSMHFAAWKKVFLHFLGYKLNLVIYICTRGRRCRSICSVKIISSHQCF